MAPATTQAQQFRSGVTPEEWQAYGQLPEGSSFFDPSEVRKRAAEILSVKPESFVAQLLLGRLEYEHGNYPRSIYHLKQARERLEGLPAYEHLPQSGEEPHWHALVLYRMAISDMALDRLPEQLDALDAYAKQHYERFEIRNNILRPAAFYRLSALVKLGRIDEAHALAEEALQRPGLSVEEKLAAREDLTLVERFRQKDSGKIYALYHKLLQEVDELGQTPGSSLLGALAYFSQLEGKYDEAAQALKRSARELKSRSSSHPYFGLAQLLLLQADWQAAREALRQCWQWLPGKRSYLRQELSKENRLAVAEFYLASGDVESAWRISSMLVNNPVRSGFRWRFSEQWEAASVLTALSALRQARLLRKERTIMMSWTVKLKNALSELDDLLYEQILKRKFRALVLERLKRPLPPLNALEAIDTPGWLFGEMVRLLGTGPSRQLLEAYPLTGRQHIMFFDAVNAEIAYQERDWENTLTFCWRAVVSLPRTERLWRARILAIQANVLRKLDKIEQAVVLMVQAYRINPAVFRHLDMQVPVSFLTDQSETRRRIIDALGHSSLLIEHHKGLRISIEETADGGLSASVLSPNNSVLKNILIFIRGSETPEIFQERAVHSIRQQLFVAGPLLEQADYDALEGRAIKGPSEENERLQRMMETPES